MALSLAFDRTPDKGEYKANVSILISAYNEEEHINSTLLNKLEQDYDNGEIQIIVISDQSTDKTDEIVSKLNNDEILFLRQTPRQGKTAALNMALEHATGDIIVFSDANSIYTKDAVRHLVNNFQDESVGYVTGKMIYSNPDGSVIGDGCDSYMRYENLLRTLETRVNSVVGVDGGIDAIRKNLFQKLSADQLPDFVHPLQVIEQGYRVIYDDEAVLKENSLSDQKSEYRMRVRVSLRALWALYDMRKLLNPVKYGIFSWQLLSHKVIRYLAWLPLAILIPVNILLASQKSIFVFFLIAQIFFYVFSFIGWLNREKDNQSSLFSIPFYFVLTNIAALHAFTKFLRKQKTIIWTPRSG